MLAYEYVTSKNSIYKSLSSCWILCPMTDEDVVSIRRDTRKILKKS